LGINSQLVNSSNAYSNMFNFRFTIKQGHFITVEILETHIYEIIAKAIVRKNSDKYSYFDVNPRNIDDWIYNEYSKLHADEREKAKKKSSFAGGYAQYDPNDHKGFGSQKQWQEEFKKATGNKGFKDEDGTLLGI
jgi:hypothetical protein